MRQSGLTCSIVICTRNRPAQLERCLEGLSHLTYPSFEVVVVDNASDDDQARRIAARWGVRYTVEPMRGLSRARNRGVLASIGEIIAFIDDDAVPRSEWLDALVSEFQD